MATRFEDWLTSLRLSWMGTNAKRIFGGFAAALGDRAETEARQAVLEHMPSYASAESNQLTASERLIEPGSSETNDHLAMRLVAAVPTAKLAGAPMSILLALEGVGYDYGNGRPVLVQQNGRAFFLVPTGTSVPAATVSVDVPGRDDLKLFITTLGINAAIAGSPPWWTFGSGPTDNAFCSRFSLLLTTVPSGWDFATEPSTTTLNQIRRLGNRWRGGKATWVNIIAFRTGFQWGWPRRKWGSGGTKWGGGTHTTYRTTET